MRKVRASVKKKTKKTFTSTICSYPRKGHCISDRSKTCERVERVICVENFNPATNFSNQRHYHEDHQRQETWHWNPNQQPTSRLQNRIVRIGLTARYASIQWFQRRYEDTARWYIFRGLMILLFSDNSIIENDTVVGINQTSWNSTLFGLTSIVNMQVTYTKRRDGNHTRADWLIRFGDVN